MSRRRLGAFLAAALLGAAAGQAAAGPVAAAGGYCAQGTGVTVVVDNGSLGGGSSVGCDPNGANTAGSTVVPRAGYPLTYVQRQPGFVCKVAGAPASASCGNTPPADAYWGLFWSDGKSGTWNYSSSGIGSLKVPAGGFIGWRFQNSSTRSRPGPAPVSPAGSSGGSPKPTSKPSPSRTATSGPTGGGSGAGSTGGSGGSGGGSGTPTRGTGASTPGAVVSSTAAAQARKNKAAAIRARAKAGARASAKASASASASASTSPSPTAGETEPTDGTDTADTHLSSGEQATESGPALPLFAGGLLVVLLATAGTLAWRRRRG